MDPLSALAMVAAVFQFADFGGKLLGKTWERLAANNGRAEDDLSHTIDHLNALYSSVKAKASRAPGPDKGYTGGSRNADALLHSLCDECSHITSDFKTVLLQMKTRRSSKIKGFGGVSQPLVSLASFWNKDKTDEMTNRLQGIRHRITEAVLVSIWELSQESTQIVYDYGQQLRIMTKILWKLEGSQKPTASLTGVASHTSGTDDLEEPSLDDGESIPVPEASLESLLNVMNRGSLSARQIRREVMDTLHGDSTAAQRIRKELIAALWTKEWLSTADKENQSFSMPSSVLARRVTQSIKNSLVFDTVEAREEAVAQTFDKTYSWIFNKQPTMAGTQPLWPSFPDWLKNPSSTRYWITGKPGSGKSTMMKFILGHEHLKMHLEKWAEPLPLVITSYYAWHSGLTLQKSIEGLKRTLLLQALARNEDLARTLAPRRWAFLSALRNGDLDLPPWKTWEIEESFSALLRECGKTMMLALFIDGLDEFESPPEDIIRLVQSISARSKTGVKLCVASRPWHEFDDAFNDGPLLQMHLLTKQDMFNFVTAKLNGNKGFLEVQQVYPAEVVVLKDEIVSKASGIFLWVSLVVRDLLLSVSEGATIADLRSTLEALPPDLSSLYDAIWSRIPSRNLADASFMLQLVRAAQVPMRWLVMWVADESRTAQIDLGLRPAAATWKPAAWKNLRRRLASRTRGILELTQEHYHVIGGGGQVDFAHRTARDWAIQPHVWERVCSAGPADFDPCLALLQAETVILADHKERSQMTYERQWWEVTRALWYGSQVKDTPANAEALVKALDNLDRASVDLKWQPALGSPTKRHERWAMPGWARDSLNTFPGLTAQFAIVPYLRIKIRSEPTLLFRQLTRNTFGLMENVVFGFKYYLPPAYYSLDGFSPEIPLDQRYKAVQLLLDMGAKLADTHSHIGLRPIKDVVYTFATDRVKLPYQREVSEEEKLYFGKVAECFQQRDLKSKWKSVSVRLRFALIG